MKKILGIGNALIDELVQLQDDSFLIENQLPKGSMQLIDYDSAIKISEAVRDMGSVVCSGGSAANTVCGLARLGAKASFLGKVADDRYGQAFLTDMKAYGVNPLVIVGESMSGFCTSLVSPDGERTMVTFLGAAATLSADDITDDIFQYANILYMEGYLLQNHDLIEKAATMAQRKGLLVAIDLASYNIVEENLDFLQYLVQEYVEIVFANEQEAKALVGTEPDEAVEQLAEMCSVAVVKVGSNGSWLMTGGQKQFIRAFPAQAVDTTGAGDLYAAGFLYGYINGFDVKSCGKIASNMAARIVETVGTKHSDEQFRQIKEWLSHLRY
jgi:sugar/nucleoside kinase (ribokinase family)